MISAHFFLLILLSYITHHDVPAFKGFISKKHAIINIGFKHNNIFF